MLIKALVQEKQLLLCHLKKIAEYRLPLKDSNLLPKQTSSEGIDEKGKMTQFTLCCAIQIETRSTPPLPTRNIVYPQD